jgi:hypothetical protein
MKAVDIAKVRALTVSESQKSECHWKQPREDNYEPVLQMLEERTAQLQHGSNQHSSNLTFRGALRSVARRKNGR